MPEPGTIGDASPDATRAGYAIPASLLLLTLLLSLPGLTFSFSAGEVGAPLTALGSELAARLPAWICAILLPPATALLLRNALGRRGAAIAGLLLALHFSLLVQATDANGYSMLTLGAFAVGLLLTRFLPGKRLVVVIPVCLASVLLALAVGCPDLVAQLFRGEARPTDPLFMEALATYLTGSSTSFAFLLLLPLCLGGLVVLQAHRGLLLAFALPAAMVGLCALLHGSRETLPRLTVMIPALMIGVAMLIDRFWQRWPAVGTVLLGGWMVASLTGAAPMYHRHLTLRHADLKGLAEELHGRRVVLTGDRGEQHGYYFPDAAILHSDEDLFDASDTFDALDGPPGAVVEGGTCGRPERPVLVESGYRYSRTLEPWSSIYPAWERTATCVHLWIRVAE